MKSWAYGEWIEYQAWLFHHGFLTLYDWQLLRDQAQCWKQRPLLKYCYSGNTAPDECDLNMMYKNIVTYSNTA